MRTSEAPEGTSSANGKNRWFQLGLVSAGAAAPLIARWRSLRAAEQAEALREQASARWNNAMERVVSSLPQEAIQETLRQALPQAQESLRQVSSAARTALQRLPAVNLSTPEPVIVAAPRSNRRVNTTLWLVGVSVGVVAAGAVAYVMLRNRISAASDDDTLVEIPLTAVMANDTLAAAQADAASAATDGPAIIEEPADEEPGIAEPLQFSEDDAEGAAFIGNILSRVYHPANSKRLPALEHRIYFDSEEEATEAGYRPDGAEIASRASDAPGDHE
jgi:hypothetical protein